MKNLAKYDRRKDATIVAVQMNLAIYNSNEPGTLQYRKWGALQKAKVCDWIVNNGGECYTIDAESFANTYELVDLNVPGIYFKSGSVWAKKATEDGSIKTKEGKSHYVAGDWIVFNNEDGTDGYKVTDEKFRQLYVQADPVRFDLNE